MTHVIDVVVGRLSTSPVSASSTRMLHENIDSGENCRLGKSNIHLTFDNIAREVSFNSTGMASAIC
jgi:hypothetical protein